jgi:hypothetical protein
MVGVPGLEPGTSSLSVTRSSQLSYTPVEFDGYLQVSKLCFIWQYFAGELPSLTIKSHAEMGFYAFGYQRVTGIELRSACLVPLARVKIDRL